MKTLHRVFRLAGFDWLRNNPGKLIPVVKRSNSQKAEKWVQLVNRVLIPTGDDGLVLNLINSVTDKGDKPG